MASSGGIQGDRYMHLSQSHRARTTRWTAFGCTNGRLGARCGVGDRVPTPHHMSVKGKAREEGTRQFRCRRDTTSRVCAGVHRASAMHCRASYHRPQRQGPGRRRDSLGNPDGGWTCHGVFYAMGA
eukprot:CAMPEP_0174385238 /NCGR_PEP_ID=MMETSP0811_2-20130205/126464_1 /TAXON_ID=73025 ORGANISM="Eutreptiella gymnastica-like, Strain CCMP1594" /NCGR_SAMPLE_ID=MMETSP0811_2 /ASSEMBLY_ACC=CAM_ASM_000667 /LENGTH=125 /DNA_ID=CAMNT_0015539483 /DNA_START=685 /DNA_END=1062 /DNA_ORIENTATION=-